VFTIKINNEGDEVVKARLVAVGCKDSNTYELTETYSPVCPIELIRITLSIATTNRMQIVTMDVVTAYLYGKIEREIYLRIPEGLNRNKEEYLLKVSSAIYGLKIAGKTWYETLITELMKIGFVRSLLE